MHKKLIILFCFFLDVVHLPAKDSIPPLDSLFEHLAHFYQQQLEAELSAFQISEKKVWLKYIPSIGVGYTLGIDQQGNLKNTLRPSMTYSTSTLYQVFQDKEARKAKMESIKQLNRVALENQKLELEAMVYQYYNEYEELAFLERLHVIDEQLFAIATSEYEKAALPPSQYLPKKRDYLNKQFTIFQKKKELRAMKIEILRVAKVF